ncbi:aminotransferase class III-fold pyridoxal phosphate-dependent enzyme [Bradyrhizobium sp. 160]|uniref:aminotransferase class III-fold pyridoxal phosphate-dependent enzyme n=1 Tax=Bradyrhizobium sp. 160 TaxID=2782634 RepID=UPI001FF9BB28|nr:aminotransferase class III-fold pyridoxal phosphate-dependent enzyme [Bradyrhizobium sp. 160]MCK1625231.1 aminotransferase class III-fold pyridoxal phosphate-dependent enzyme [Bradyrhizobium sp. 160]
MNLTSDIASYVSELRYVACREHDAAALVVEPLVSGAGGMLMYPAWVLREVKRISATWGVLLIADEVMTGWGRTGMLFACSHAEVSPDITCCSKGPTGGSLPLAVSLCSAELFEAHHSKARARTFFHSISYAANPVACAASKASIDLGQADDWNKRAASISPMREIKRLRCDERFENVRRIGTITALELRARDAGYHARAGPKIGAFFLEVAICCFVRSENTIYVMPPYCVTAEGLGEIYGAIQDAPEVVG